MTLSRFEGKIAAAPARSGIKPDNSNRKPPTKVFDRPRKSTDPQESAHQPVFILMRNIGCSTRSSSTIYWRSLYLVDPFVFHPLKYTQQPRNRHADPCGPVRGLISNLVSCFFNQKQA